ncbi:MAG: hypothetical protein ACK56F_31255, partial [bacterium]
QQGADQHGPEHQRHHHGPWKLAEVQLEQADQGDQPAQQDQSGEQQSPAGGAAHAREASPIGTSAQRPNLSSSAGEASRSMATK